MTCDDCFNFAQSAVLKSSKIKLTDPNLHGECLLCMHGKSANVHNHGFVCRFYGFLLHLID